MTISKYPNSGWEWIKFQSWRLSRRVTDLGIYIALLFVKKSFTDEWYGDPRGLTTCHLSGWMRRYAVKKGIKIGTGIYFRDRKIFLFV
jgi:hypothetical protein